MVAQGAAHQHCITGTNLRAAQVHALGESAHATRINIDAVAMAPVHHLGVAGDEPYAGLARRLGHGSADAAQVIHGKALFQNEGAGEIQRAGAGGGHVVHGAAHRQTADVAAGKEMRRHHEAVRGVGDALTRREGRQHRRVIAAQKLVGAVGLEEHLVDDALHHGTAGTMPQHYLLVCHYINLPVVVSTSLPFFTPLVPKMRLATLCTRPVSPRMTITSKHICSSTCTCIVEMMVSK